MTAVRIESSFGTGNASTRRELSQTSVYLVSVEVFTFWIRSVSHNDVISEERKRANQKAIY